MKKGSFKRISCSWMQKGDISLVRVLCTVCDGRYDFEIKQTINDIQGKFPYQIYDFMKQIY